MFSGNFVSFTNVDLKDGFWQNRYQLNKNVSIESVKTRFEDSGRFDALRFNYLKTGKAPHFFYDSDVAKWIEGVAYIMEKDRESMKANEELIDALKTCDIECECCCEGECDCDCEDGDCCCGDDCCCSEEGIEVEVCEFEEVVEATEAEACAEENKE